MKKKEEINLKLIGKNSEDLSTFSAYLQDSLIKVVDISYLKKNKIFILMLNRFMWEDAEKGIFRQPKRIKCVLKFVGVLKVISKNVNQEKKDKILEFLTMSTVLNDDDIYEVRLIFSGNSNILLFVEQIDVLFEDIGSSWVVKNQPKHI